MKIRILSILSIAALLLALPLSSADKKPVASLWTDAPVQIDGQLTDWAPEALTAYPNFEIRFGFKNDAQNLYCAFVFDNPRYLSSIEASGLTFWVNPEKEKRTHGFRFYRKMVSPDELIAMIEKSGTPPTEQRKAEIKAKPSYVLYACDVLDKKGDIIPHHPGTVNGLYRVARVQKMMVFEYVIPLALLVDPNLQPPLDQAKPFKLGFEWGGMTAEMRKQMAANLGADNVRARSGSGDMTTGGEESGVLREGGAVPSASLEDSMRRMPKKYDFWIDLKLGVK